MIEKIREWLLTCPLLADQRLNVNHLLGYGIEYSIVEAPTTPIVTQYMDGSSIRQKVFALAALKDESPDILQNIAESGFWEQFTHWVEQQNRLRNYPDFGTTKRVRKVAVTSTHYLLSTTPTTARWQIQLSVTYYQKGER